MAMSTLQGEEINLMDYVKVIWKRKLLILSFFGIGIGGILGLSIAFLPRIYQIDTILEIGMVGEELVQTPSQLVNKIKGDVYGILVRAQLGISEKEYPRIEVENPKDTQLVKLTIKSVSADKAQKVLEELNNFVVGEHEEQLKQKREIIENTIRINENKIALVESDIEKVSSRMKINESDITKTKNKIIFSESDIERVKNKIEHTKEEQKNLEAKVDALEKVLSHEQTPGTQFALFDAKEKLANKKKEIEDLYSKINSLKIEIENFHLAVNALEKTREDYSSQINFLKTTIEDLYISFSALRGSLKGIISTKVIKFPAIPEEPIRPKPLLNGVVGGILGLFLGVMFAFAKEWWQKSLRTGV